ncbi:ABC transporter ATP-binding protein [Exilibacterium tricleocarpae]|uniref:ABC transporter ATP-binding protein n=1 Tax=Exilibacterium tricleocarpae TaxID=2591008 RepID=A0A545U9T2_9GAMM|nr:ABC transporter ATP-binding protein [Exilibacterium tricleocarpae]TQV86234.1 ABC transporter ATP-binding protein [Exilibacterium tricleocarpae]
MQKSKRVEKPLPIWQGRRRLYLAGLVAMGIAQAVVILGVGMLVARVFTRIGNSPDTGTVADVALPLALIAVAAVVLAVLRWAERVCAEHLGQDYVVQMRLRLFRHLLRANQRVAQRWSHGAMMLRFVTDLNGLRRWVALGLGRLLVIVTTAVVVLGALTYLQPMLAGLIAAVLLIGLLIGGLIGSGLPAPTRAARKYRARLAATVNDRVSTVSTVQAYLQEQREMRRVRRQSKDLYRELLGRAHILGFLQGALEATGVLATAALLIAGLGLVGEGRLTAGDIAGGMTLTGLLLSPLRDLGRIFDYWQQWQISHEKIAGFMRLPARRPRTATPAAVDIPPEGPGHLRARGFAIDGLLEPCDFDIEAGQHIVLEGANGVGKTTLLLTLAGVLPLQRGSLELDGCPLSAYGDMALRRAGIGLVSPDLGLMRGSLARNITYANPGASEQEIAAVIRDCGLAELVESLPGGLKTRLSEGGKNLSLGERKRVMLARTLLIGPRLLLLDEMDAHLDSQSLKLIEAALAHFQGTVIEVSHSHRLSLKKRQRRWLLQERRLNEITNDSVEDLC